MIALERNPQTGERRIVIERKRKLVYSGEWCKHKSDVLNTFANVLEDEFNCPNSGVVMEGIVEREYDPEWFVGNSGPKKGKKGKPLQGM